MEQTAEVLPQSTRPNKNAMGSYNFRKKSELVRDSRGSLEVFGGAPQTSAIMFPKSDQEELQAAGIPQTSRKFLEEKHKPQDKLGLGTESGSGSDKGLAKVKENVDRWLASVDEKVLPSPSAPVHSSKGKDSEMEDEGLQNSSQPGFSKSYIPVISDSGAPLAGSIQEPSQDLEPDGNGPELSDDAKAGRAKEWGLVLRADAKGPLREERISGISMRTSEASDGGSELVPRVSRDLKDALSSFQQTFVVSDASRPDFPILYASASFFNMTGYSPREVIGRNCRFLQGPDTDPEHVAQIRATLKDGKHFCGRLLNYKKDGTPFWNLLTIAPIKDEKGKTLKYIGMQVEVSKYTEGLKEKSLRPNGMPESLIKYDARQKERASTTVQELVGAVKRPQAYVQNEVPLPPPLPLPLEEKSTPPVPPVPLEAEKKKSRSRRSIQTSKPEKSRLRPRAKSESRILEVPEAVAIGEGGVRLKHRASGFLSKLGITSKAQQEAASEMDDLDLDGSVFDEERPDSLDDVRTKDIRRGIDLATTLERIEKNFVITDPRLPDNPIIFASDQFLELTEYTREEILGRNCRFLQGPDTDVDVVKKISEAISEQKNITVQLLNYTKTGKPFWNLFHLEAMKDSKGHLQYFIGVQLDGSEYVEPVRNRLSERTEMAGKRIVQATAKNIEGAVQELPDANSRPEDLWAKHSSVVFPKPHKRDSSTWEAMKKVLSSGEKLGLTHFRPIKPLGCGDTGSVHLVELRGTSELYAMKAMDKSVMLNRNKIHRACAEREILAMMDYPFVPTLYGSFQTRTHVCLITEYCPGGELFLLLERQPMKIFREESARFYAAEIVLALEYLHCMGVIYRDLKPENVLVQRDGHVQLTDFDLSFLTTSRPQLIKPVVSSGRKKRRSRKDAAKPYFLAEPIGRSNSFVGTEEYIAPEIISGFGHNSSVDWWALGILLYEMLFGRTPFRGRNRQRTFANVLHKDLTFPSSIPVSLSARQIIRGLLQRDPTRRLGSDKGANAIKAHPFFKGINWPLIRCMAPPPLETPIYQIEKEADLQTPKAEFEWDESISENFSDVF